MKKLLLLAAMAMAGMTPRAGADTIFESATLGPTGQNGGSSLSADQFLAVGFTLTDAYSVDHVGGHIAGIGTLFAAIVALPGPGQVPAFAPSAIGANALADAVFTIPSTSADILTPLSVDLGPGDYALVIGQGEFGAVGDGFMPASGTDIATPSYFFSQGGVWIGGGFSNTRFVVTGTLAAAVPEPASLAMLGVGALGALGLARRRRAA